MKRILLIPFLLMTLILPQAQQKSSNTIRFSFDAGGGFYNTFSSPIDGVNGKGSSGVSFLFSMNYYYKKHIIKLRYLNHNEYLNLTSAPLEIFSDAGVLYGRSFYKTKKTSINLFAGTGIIKGTIRGKFIPYAPPADYSPSFSDWLGPFHFGNDYEEVKIFTPALLQEIEFIHYPSKHFGVGVSITGNINSKSSHMACFFKLCIGKYR